LFGLSESFVFGRKGEVTWERPAPCSLKSSSFVVDIDASDAKVDFERKNRVPYLFIFKEKKVFKEW
jgi:hypothetical protein